MIDELQRVKDFHSSQPPASEAARNAARSALAQAIAVAEPQHRQAPTPGYGRRFPRYVRAPRILPIGVAVAATAAAALFITTPWSSSPDFLARAEAALTPPTDMILHAKLAQTTDSCSVPWTAQYWADERTGRYRGLFRDGFLPYPFRYFTLKELHNNTCGTRVSPRYEAGLVLGSRDVLFWSEKRQKFVRSTVLLRFVPPNTLYRYPPQAITDLNLFGRVPALDPVAAVRTAIRDGRARDQGRTKLSGRAVERIRLDPCPPGKCMNEAGGYAYVDPETYYPVEIDIDGRTIRFFKYEYLSRTAVNLALTNIRAQHPHARVTDRG